MTQTTRMRYLRNNLAVGLIAGIFFFLPLTVYAVGIRSVANANETPTKLSINLTSWTSLNSIDNFAIHNFPLQEQTIRFNTRLNQDVFHQAPSLGQDSSVAGVGVPTGNSNTSGGTSAESNIPKNSQKGFLQLPPTKPEAALASTSLVTIGKNGWLYYTYEFSKECAPAKSIASITANLSRLEKIIAASGRSFVFTLAPDKSIAVPKYLPANYPYKSCALPGSNAIFKSLSGANIPGYINMNSLITQHQSNENREYYMRMDTHWNGLATGLFAELAASYLNPALIENTQMNEMIVPYTGDLTVLLGAPKKDTTITTKIIRSGVTVGPLKNVSIGAGITTSESVSATSASPLLIGRTLLVGDSFAEATISQIMPFASNFIFAKNIYFQQAPETMFNEIQNSKTIILIWSERYFTDSNYGVLWSTPFLNKLQKLLKPLAS